MSRARWITRRRVVAGAFPLAMAVFIPVAHSASTSPAGCATGRPGLVHGPNGTNSAVAQAVPCLTTTFHDFGETNIAVTAPVRLSTGTIPAAVMHGGTYPPYGPPTMGVARTVDLGAHWNQVIFPASSTEPTGATAHDDPSVYRDPNTNRLFFVGEGMYEGVSALVTNCDANISFTDDNGETWTNNPGPRLQFCPAWDAPAVWTGPPTTSKLTGSYPDVVYFCQSSHVIPPPGGRQCFKSVDGGVAFTEIGGSPTADAAGNDGACAAGPDGTLYGLSGDKLYISKDEGTTWSSPTVTVPVSGTPTGGTGPNHCVAVDDRGDLYVAGKDSKNLPVLTYSTDQGAHWSTPVEAQMPGVGHVDWVALAADWSRPGHVAVAYVGDADKAADTPDVPEGYHEGGPHHGYLTVTGNTFAGSLTTPTPTFTSVQVDSDKDSLLPWGYPAAFNSSTSPSRVDYVGVTFNPSDGRPWAAFAKDTCETPACSSTGSADTIQQSVWTNWLGAVATISDQ